MLLKDTLNHFFYTMSVNELQLMNEKFKNLNSRGWEQAIACSHPYCFEGVIAVNELNHENGCPMALKPWSRKIFKNIFRAFNPVFTR